MKTKAGYYLENLKGSEGLGFAILYPDGTYDFGNEFGNFYRLKVEFPHKEFIYLCDLDGNLDEEAIQNKIESKLFDIEFRKSFEAICQDWVRLDTFQRRPEFNRLFIDPAPLSLPSEKYELKLKDSDMSKAFNGGMTKTHLTYCFLALIGLCLIGGIFWTS